MLLLRPVFLLLVTTVFMTIPGDTRAGQEEGTRVDIEDGTLRGHVRWTRQGRNFLAFEGVPYAEPPVGDLRFLPPVPINPWPGVKEATKVHSVCPQRDIYRRSEVIEGDEDCLYLNVYTPQLAGREALPVMIFFHGGGWLCGGGNSQWYGPDILLDRDVVLVVTNYRLGALGFLSMYDEVAPGNNGLKDQNLAMKWVKKNIAQFGGDPDSITIVGESAGGASVEFHMLSPMSKGLFHAGISQSGTSMTTWALAGENEARTNAKKLAKSFDCPLDRTYEMLDCLRKVPVYDIIAKDKMFMEWDTDPMIPFKPVIEPKNVGSAFLAADPREILESGDFYQVPWMTGINSEDGAIKVAGLFDYPQLIEDLNKNFTQVMPISLLLNPLVENPAEVASKIRQFYFGSKKIWIYTRDSLVEIYTDGWFLQGIDESIRYHLKYNSNQSVYYYLFEFRGQASFTEIFGDPKQDFGVCHADELQYLFPVGDGLFPDRPPSAEEKKMAEIMTTLWVNFARTGNPTPDDETTRALIPNKWTPVRNDEMQYFNINIDDLSMKEGLFAERAKFWRELMRRGPLTRPRDEL